MKNYLDFKKVSLYSTYIKNIKWTFNFMKEKIIATTELNYKIYEGKVLSKDINMYTNYRECFDKLIEEIKTLEFCNICNRLDDSYCKKCELGNIIDEITCLNIDDNVECPICYKNLTLRYVFICTDERHKICTSCYNCLEMDTDILCPLCRKNREYDI
tara:strand:+ start:83 stop:556 length:474 start_codon:yes stop_codon:yes gene_type:complete